MSSHREAPEVSKDPVVDSSDLYAFVSPDAPDTVTFIANYVPLQNPAGGPNFYEFGDDVLYAINIDTDGDGVPDIVYQFTFESELEIPSTFLYNTGPIESLSSANWNRRQFYSVTRVDNFGAHVLGQHLPCPPCNIGPLSTPNYATLASAAINSLPGGGTVYCGQRAEGFYVDLGAIFDLGDLRPIANLHATFGLPALTATPGVDTLGTINVHSIALQVPISSIHSGWRRRDSGVIGVWTTASRQQARVFGGWNSEDVWSGPWTQRSRLGNPLFNEVLVPLSQKDYWNKQSPANDSQFAQGVNFPELAQLLPVLYPTAFPNLSAFNATNTARADLAAILLTGIPAGIVSPTFTTYTGPTQADMLRLNLSIPPSKTPSILGVVGGDVAGFPNGRRVFDDVVSIELRAIAGATLPLVDPSFTPDGAIADVSDGLNGSDITYLTSFPYLGTPYSGYNVPAPA
jgi:Domain of unknown function (DUF4331)